MWDGEFLINATLLFLLPFFIMGIVILIRDYLYKRNSDKEQPQA